MKRRLIAYVIIALVIFIVSACKSDDTVNTIFQPDLSDREEGILATTTNSSFVFDFNVDDTYEEMSIWIEKYEKGELIDDSLAWFSSGVSEGKGSIIITSPKEKDEMSHPAFNMGVSSNGSTGSTTFVDDGKDVGASSKGNDVSVEDGEVVLAGVVMSDGDSTTTSFTTNFHDDPEEMKQYDLIYLFKAKPIE